MNYLKFIIPIVIIALIAAWYFVDQPRTDIDDLKTEIQIDASTFFNEYNTNETNGNIKYLDKIIEVSGKISSIEQAEDGSVNIMLESSDEMFGISCTFSPERAATADNLKEGDEIIIKGRCTGLLMDVVLIDCMIISK